MGISKITRNFQVTLPKDIREMRKLREGDKVLFVVEGAHIDLVKLDKKIVRETAGIWSELKETGVEYERRLRRGWHKRPQL